MHAVPALALALTHGSAAQPVRSRDHGGQAPGTHRSAHHVAPGHVLLLLLL